MPSIDKINIWNTASRQNIKNTLGYAVKKRNGYYQDIKMVDEKRGDTIEQFKTAGFLNSENALQKNETYSITNLGDDYYKDLFGSLNYWQKRMSGVWERFLNKTFNKKIYSGY